MIAVAAALVSGVALALSMPWFDLWPLAWVGLVPLLVVVRGRPARRGLLLGAVAGFCYHVVVLYWIVATITTYTVIPTAVAAVLLVMLAAAASLFLGGFVVGLEWLAAAGISRVVAAPALWVSIEWLRTFFPAAFPWAFLGYSQLPAPWLVQSADLAGVYGVSAMLVFVSAALAELAVDGPRRHALLTGSVVAVLVAASAYGALRIRQLESVQPFGELRIGVAQGNVAQEQKWRPENQNSTLARYLELSTRAVEEGAELVLWPEAAVPFPIERDERGRRVVEFARLSGAHLLIGTPAYRLDAAGVGRQYNEAVLISPELGIAGAYAKMRLVPFGEYVPWGGLFGLVHRVVDGIADFGRGTEHVVFEGPMVPSPQGPRRARVSALVCYEGIFPGLTRRFVAAGADVLVNLSNDAWYGTTSAPYQLLAMVAMRAVENRVPVIRATNTGVSAVVDVTGGVHDATALYEEAVIVDAVPLRAGRSLYARTGDLFVYLCIALLAALAWLRYRAGAVLIVPPRRGKLPR